MPIQWLRARGYLRARELDPYQRGIAGQSFVIVAAIRNIGKWTALRFHLELYYHSHYNIRGCKTFTQDMQLLPGTYTFRFSDGTANASYALVVGAVTHIR